MPKTTKAKARGLREIREFRGHSQTDIAEYLGISNTAVSKIELEENNIQRKHINRLCSFLKCSENELLGNVEFNNKDLGRKIREVKGDYLKYSMEIIEDMKDSQYLDKEEKAELLNEVYPMIYDFFEESYGKANKEKL